MRHLVLSWSGEFHTLVSDGPIFAHPISLEVGPVVVQDDRFAFCDLLAR